MSDGEALLSIKADVKDASAKLKQLAAQNERLTGKVERLDKQTKRTTGSQAEFAAKIGLAAMAAQNAYQQLDELSKRAVRIRAVYQNAAFGIDEAREATQGLVTDFTLLAQAQSAKKLGVAKTGKEFAELTEAATKLGLAAGRDAADSVQYLIEGLGRGSTEVLDNLNVVLRAQDAYEEYAERMGKSAKDLSEYGKRQAVLTIGTERAIEAAKDLEVSTDDAAGAMQRFIITIKNGANDVFRLDELIGDLAHEMEIAFGEETWDSAEDAFDDYIGYLTLGLDDAIAKWAEYNKQAAQAALFTTSSRVGAAARRAADEALGLNETTGERGNVSNLNADAEAARLEAQARAEAEAGKPEDNPDLWKDRGGGGRKRTEAAENRDTFTTAFDVREEAFRIEAERELEAMAEARALEQAQVESGIAQMERDVELREARAATEAEAFEAELYRFDQEVQMAEIRGAMAEERMLSADTEQERLAAYEEMAQARHEAEMLRIDAEMSAEQHAAQERERIQKRRQDIASTSIEIARTTTATMGQIWSEQAQNAGKSGKALFAIEKGIKVSLLAIDAITYTSRSISAFIAQDYFSGAKFAAAAAASTASAISTATLDMDSAKGKVGAGGGGGGSPFGGGGGFDSGAEAPPDSEIPASRGGSPVQPSVTTRSGGQTPNTTTIGNVQILGAVDDETAEKLVRAIDKARADGLAAGG